MLRVRLGLVVAAMFLGGCLGPQSTECAWGVTCPPGRVCHAPTLECVNPELVEACVGLEELASCSFSGAGEGSFCQSGLCLSPECGDGEIHAPEQCEGDDLDGMTCESFRFNGGTLSCSASCTFDTSDCVGDCGDGLLNGQEACDGTNLAGATCQGLGFYFGELSCTTECTFDLTNCFGRCGDGIVDPSEDCDGTDLAGTTCDDLGLYGGTLVCTSTCGFNAIGCYTSQEIDVCVLDAATSDPEPFVDCDTAQITGEPLVDFGIVQFQQDASRVVAIRSHGAGHARIDNVSVSNNTGQGGHYSLALYWLDENQTTGESTEIPASVPVYLDDVIYVRVTFDADLDGFLPEEYLTIDVSSDPNNHDIPIFGVVSGCPVGYWDINGDPNDGCEYICDYSGPEVCDGVDNNCDSDTDGEDAMGCTVYYLDVDNDSYGVTADTRCLCQPDTMTHHTALQSGDCDDAKHTVNPGMVEQCSTPDDDDCDGDTNDENAFGCANYYIDQDYDSYGVTTDMACHCSPTGSYTATQGGDCDDMNGLANPGQQEDCLTAYDDNCNSNTNDANAANCTDFYVDLDGDNYGQTWLSQCLCTGQGSYTATLSGDCNDNNVNVNPSVPEDCLTAFDDNCDQDTNELNAVNCIIFYYDADNDGYGLDGDFQCRCAAVGNYRVMVGGDCDDSNGLVNPSAVETCGTVYDDNCDGDTNDLNATGCTTYFYDQDGDNYGVSTLSMCLCQVAGFYTAMSGGDCDDDPTTCGAACNPGMSESCASSYDENCNGDTNDLDALNCVAFFWDQDGDGYGTSIYQCRCAAFDNYTASLPGDCMDSVPAINPGATEVCDLVDNNCMGGIDEGFDLLSDVNHCGACNNVCTNDHGTTACISGVCTPSCSVGWGDCNDVGEDGCETDLATVTSCGTCTVDAHCPPGFYCEGGSTCQAEKADGDTCGRDGECTSDHCVDGYCCNTSCDSTCEACDITGWEGACTPHTDGADPENECNGTPQSTCGQNGFCDGNGGCAQWASGTVCVAQSCSGNTLYPADTCNGSGACVDGGLQDCSPYLCNGSVCRTDCSVDGHCTSGNYCNGGGCEPKRLNGEICGATNECQSGSCADGVCCDTPCATLCRACNLSGAEGTCTNTPNGLDAQNECGLCRVCNGSGSCMSASDGSDPKDDCTAQSQSTCGHDGECNGSGGCRYWAFGTECVAQSCSGETRYLADTCNGAGGCVDGGSATCAPYVCSGDSCLTICSLSAHCAVGYHCEAPTCVAD